MLRNGRFRSALIAGWACVVMFMSSGAASAAPDDPAQLLKHADAIKTANNAEFASILNRLDAESARLTRRAIRDEVNVNDLAMCCERVAQHVLR